jgi:hypothetical protein
VEGGSRGDKVTVLRSGSVLRLSWEETIPHDSHFRISFDRDGEDDFADPPEMKSFDSNSTVLIDDIADDGDTFTVDVPLPDIECERCTLQLIQVMYDKQPYEVGGDDIYYQCVDLALRKDAPCAGAGDGGAGDASVCNAPVGGGDGGGDGDGDSDQGGSGDGDGSGNGDGDGDGDDNDANGSGSGGGYGGGSGTPAAANGESTGSACAVTHARSLGGATWLALVASAFVLRARRRLFRSS